MVKPASKDMDAPSTSSTADCLTGRHSPKNVPPMDKKQRQYRSCKVCGVRINKETGNWARKDTTHYRPSCIVGL